MYNKKHFLIAVLFFSLIFSFLFYKTNFEYISSYITFSCIKASHSLISFFAKPFNYCANQKKLLDDLNNLKTQYNQLSKAHLTLVYSLDDLKKRESIAHASSTFKHNFCFSKILLKKCAPHEQRFIIDRGSIHGIKVSMPVVFGSILIGKIYSVSSWYSEVLLITDSLSRVPVHFQNSNARGIIEGLNSKDQLRITFVEEGYDIQEKSYIFSSGEGLIYPQGFSLGSVEKIIRDGSVYNTIIVKPIIEIDTIEYCQILFNENVLEKNEECLKYIDEIWDAKKNGLINTEKKENIIAEEITKITPLPQITPIKKENIEIKKITTETEDKIIEIIENEKENREPEKSEILEETQKFEETQAAEEEEKDSIQKNPKEIIQENYLQRRARLKKERRLAKLYNLNKEQGE